MADKRKLQTEIDRTLKKVDEGVELFDEIWEKVYSARDPNHKEKYEQDLKKEIKKLQRHRDQIKTWLGMNDIKDKKNLTDARKLIESKMEQFKVCEKEAKTKMFSKEGLAREQKVDPKEAAKGKTRDWVGNAISALNTQMESFDADLERLSAGKGKSKNKDEIAALEASVNGLKRHVGKLEQIVRLMDNDLLDPDKIDEIKDDIEYFVESNQDPDYQAQYGDAEEAFEELYGGLDIDEAPIQITDLLNQDRAPKKSPREGGEEEGGGEDGDDKDADKSITSSTSKSGSVSNKEKKPKDPSIPTGIGRPQPAAKGKEEKPVKAPAPAPAPAAKGGKAAAAPAPAPAAPAIGKPMAAAVVAGAQGGKTLAQAVKGTAATAAAAAATPATGTGTGGATADGVKEKQAAAALTAQQQQQQQQQAAAAQRQQQQQQQQQQAALASSQQQLAQQQAAQQQTLAAQQAQLVERQRLMQQQQAAGAGAAAPPGPSPTPPQQTPPLQPATAPSPTPLQQQQQQQQQPPQPPLAAVVAGGGPGGEQPGQPPLGLDVSVGGAAAEDVAVSAAALDGSAGGAGGRPAVPLRTAPETLQMQMNCLNRAMLYMPTQHDSERPKQYFPRNPYPVNAAFPMAPAPIFETPAIFEKLGPDTLFFIFYYQQGTYQQYLAAKELKKQSWRYHKKYMTWFQRHEEPKVTTDEYEQGTYVYFDCESGWCTRIKQEFTFEYAYLESEEL